MPLFGKPSAAMPEEMPHTAGGPVASFSRGGAPVDRVGQLAAKGFAETEMIDVLRKEGYSADEIDKALTEALKSGITGQSQQMQIQQQPQQFGQFEMPVQMQQTQLPELPAEFMQQQQMPEIPETSLPEQYYYPAQQFSPEEFVDLAIRERMGEVDSKMNEFVLKYQELDKRMEGVYEQLSDISKSRSTEQQQILAKIDSFKDTIDDISITIGSLEKAFKETLPSMIEAVRALTDIAQRMKSEA
jgi:hypothetical protein